MPDITQTRSLPAEPLTGQWWRRTGFDPFYEVETRDVFVAPGLQTTSSYRTGAGAGTHAYDNLSGEQLRDAVISEGQRTSSYDTGHPFDTVIWPPAIHSSGALDMPSTISGSVKYRGSIRAVNSASSSSMPGAFSGSMMSYWGTKGVEASVPTKPSAGFSTFVGELKEGLPALVGASLLKSRSLNNSSGGEYLNWEFGWKPMWSDMVKFHAALQKKTAILKTFVENSGRTLRRRRHVYSNTDTLQWSDLTAVVETADCTPKLLDWFDPAGNLSCKVHVRATYTTDVEFAGAFTYFANQADNALAHAQLVDQKMNNLLGTRVTASTLWELAPWSWLMDWYGNLGGIISNAEYLSSDSQVMLYGYLMATKTHQRVTTPGWVSARYMVGGGFKPDTYIHTSVRKTRVRASPYGFGLSPAAFTNRQWAILGALGMCQAPKVLRFNQ